MRVTRLTTVLVAMLGSVCGAHAARAEEAAAASAGVREQTYSIPVADGRRLVQLHARLCRPSSDAPARLVVINHGSPRGAANRPRMQLGRCDSEAALWFLSRGYVVAFALRRGYGETGGGWAEDYGSCSNPDYVHAGIETARDIDAVVEYATALPFVKAEDAVVVGQSAGGWGTIAYASLPHAKVSAFVVMAGAAAARPIRRGWAPFALWTGRLERVGAAGGEIPPGRHGAVSGTHCTRAPAPMTNLI
jgi:pimeloyl-ACP methyl ester carboxylesterase